MSQKEDPSEKQNLWADLEVKSCETEKPTESLWIDLGERLDFSKFKPKRVSTVEISRQNFRGEECYILKNTEANTYLQMDKKGFFLWSLMDGKHSLTDITFAYLLKYGVPPFDQLMSILSSLKKNSFLEEDAPNLYELLLSRSGAEMHKSRPVLSKLLSFWNKFSKAELSFDADGYFDWVYNHGGCFLFTRSITMLWAVISVIGTILFIIEFTDGVYDLERLGKSAALGVASLIIFNCVLILFHEHGHALTTKSFGRKVDKGGFLIYYGMPCFFVDTTDMWLGTKNQRIAVSFAGPFVTIIIGSICSIIAAMFPSSKYEPMLFEIAVIGMVSALVNFNPLLEWDGYYMLMNYLEIPGLRAKSFEFLRKDLWRKISGGHRDFSQEEKIFAAFGAMAGVWSIIAILLIPYFWAEVMYPLFGPIWSGPWNGIKIAITIIGVLMILSVINSVAAKIWNAAAQIGQA
jgi:putative peptide zinc metalloprotease protein